MLASVPGGARVVVATIGAEPVAEGGYGAALLVDGWALLGRADLRAAEDALRRWLTAAALTRPAGHGGRVVVVADPGDPTVQALVRWDPVGFAAAQLEQRTAVAFPPAVRVAVVDGALGSIESLVESAALPPETQVLGPVPLPDGAREPAFEGAEMLRMLLRTPRRDGLALARALAQAHAVRTARKSDAPVRIQIDPIDIG